MTFRFALAATFAIFAAPAAAQDKDPRVLEAQQLFADWEREAAEAILVPACEEDAAGACRALLALYDQQYGNESQTSARSVATALCDNDDALACAMLAGYARNGDGGDIDQPLQRASLRKACELGIPSACAPAAFMVRNGEGGPQDEALAHQISLAGCEAGNAESCNNAGEHLYNSGNLAAMNGDDDTAQGLHAQARPLFAEACDSGFEWSCVQLSRLLRGGLGGPSDNARAFELLDQACRSNVYQCEDRLRAEMPND